MLNLSKAIYGKLSGSALESHISTRMYKGRAPERATYPYAVFMIVSDVPEKTFTEDYESVLVQFSLFSSTSGSTEVENIFTDLKTLYDECAMTITDSTLIWMKRQNATLMIEDHTVVPTTLGTIKVWHYAVDYEVLTSLD